MSKKSRFLFGFLSVLTITVVVLLALRGCRKIQELQKAKIYKVRWAKVEIYPDLKASPKSAQEILNSWDAGQNPYLFKRPSPTTDFNWMPISIDQNGSKLKKEMEKIYKDSIVKIDFLKEVEIKKDGRYVINFPNFKADMIVVGRDIVENVKENNSYTCKFDAVNGQEFNTVCEPLDKSSERTRKFKIKVGESYAFLYRDGRNLGLKVVSGPPAHCGIMMMSLVEE